MSPVQRKSPATGGHRREAQAQSLHRHYSANEAVTAFRNAMQATGLGTPDTVQADGQIHRFKGDGDKETNAWYCLHLDGRPAGAFGSWRTGHWQTWRADGPVPDRSEQRRIARMIAAQRRHREAARRRAHQHAAERAQTWWRTSIPAEAAHPYLHAKQVRPHGLRQTIGRRIVPLTPDGAHDYHRAEQADHGERDGLLLVPLRDLDGTIWNIQRIDRDGNKRFMRGGRVAGLAAIIGNIEAQASLLICEGWATAATLHEETGHPVLAAMNCGNLLRVAKAARARWPYADIVICADNDRATPGNPGLTVAMTAVEAIGARLAVPAFADDEAGSDFNDLAKLRREVRP